MVMFAINNIWNDFKMKNNKIIKSMIDWSILNTFHVILYQDGKRRQTDANVFVTRSAKAQHNHANLSMKH